MEITMKRIDRLNASIFGDMPDAARSLGHPAYHLTAPSHFTIDFWGSVKHEGYYHIFYHVCPERGDFQENTVFGHARSKDLIHWEQLPFPILPSEDELRMNDGCICFDDKGRPVMLYTSVPKKAVPRTHCAAYGTPDLMHFERVDENPFMTLDNHGGPDFHWGWSDPYVFRADGRTFMVMSKCVTRDGNKNLLPIYEACDGSMLHWEYKGILFDNNGEVVNFFPLGDKWVLIYSPYDTIEYFVGDFDLEEMRFIPENHGYLSYGYHSQSNPIDRGFYATCLYEEKERTVLCGWVSGFSDHELWNGCMGIPRVLGLDAHGRLTQQPIPEVNMLRGEELTPKASENEVCTHTDSTLLDICFDYTVADSPVTLTVESDGRTALTLTISADRFAVNGEVYDCPCMMSGAPASARILIDSSFAEIFLDCGAVSATRCFASLGKDVTVRITAKGGARIAEPHIYRMNPSTITRA
ncbi:MAG: glycoside hydrolase family 32 protein [Clostridia bacterium]|nr:glycoside hydrolase family 32 protein [Clostridia bacterium]